MKTTLLALLLIVATTNFGCTKAEQESLFYSPESERITLYSDGKKIGEWITDGESAYSRGVYYFVDSITKKPVYISGTVVVEPIKIVQIDAQTLFDTVKSADLYRTPETTLKRR